MLAYQSGIANFEGVETKVFGVSTDNSPSQKEFAEKLKLSFPILSDFSKRQTAKDYGTLMPEIGISNRATFVIDKEGKIQHIEEGSGAIDPSGTWLYVANQKADTIVQFRIELATGELKPTDQVTRSITPVAIVFRPGE